MNENENKNRPNGLDNGNSYGVGMSNNDIFGSPNNDTSVSSSNSDIFGSPNNDTSVDSNNDILGSANSDTSVSSNNDNDIFGSSNNDTSVSSNSNNDIFGTPDNNVAVSSNNDSDIFGSPNSDTSMSSNSNNDNDIFGSPDNDTSVSSNNNDIFGTPDNNVSVSTDNPEVDNNNLNTNNVDATNVSMNTLLENSNINNGSDDNKNIDSVSFNDVSKETGKKKSKKGLLMVLIIVILLACIGFIAYRLVSNSKNMFKVAVDNVFDYMEANTLNDSTMSGDFSLKVKAKASDSISNDVLKIINKIDISGSYDIDYNQKIANVSIKSNYDSKRLINADIYMENGNGYVSFKDFYDKYISVPIEDYDTIFNGYSKKNDYKVVMDSVRNAIKDSLKDEYFTKGNDTLDGKRVTKTTLTFDKDTYNTFINDLTNTLSNDSKFLDSMASVMDSSVDEVKNSIKNIKVDDDFEKLEMVMYTDGSDFVKLDINGNGNSIVIYAVSDGYVINISEDGKDLLRASITSSSSNNYTISINSVEDNSSVEFSISNNVSYGVDVKKKDVSNSVSSDNISESELNDIYNKILSDEGIMSFLQDISAIASDGDNSLPDFDI